VDEVAFRAAEQRMWASVGIAPEERFVAGMRLQEAGTGPPVVFVHGGSNSGVSWATLVADVASSFHCLVVDRPGCGLSPKRASRFDDVDALRAEAATFVARLLDGLELDRAHVVATSFGGLLALHSAAAHPERVDRMVLFGWSVGAPTRRIPFVMRVASTRGLGRVMARLPVNERMVRSLLKRIGVTRPSDDVVACFTALLRHTPTMRNEIEAGPRIIGLRGLNESILIPRETLRNVRRPTLFLWGTADPFGGADVARAFSAGVPDATLELIDGAGHAPWLDEPARSAEALTRFLRER
jgi:pimeloyl-ACP methyl ester carboxylesterase